LATGSAVAGVAEADVSAPGVAAVGVSPLARGWAADSFRWVVDRWRRRRVEVVVDGTTAAPSEAGSVALGDETVVSKGD
jgi:hypothetical protein